MINTDRDRQRLLKTCRGQVFVEAMAIVPAAPARRI